MMTTPIIDAEAKQKSLAINLRNINERILVIQRQISRAKGDVDRFTLLARQGEGSPVALSEALATAGSLEKELLELTGRRDDLIAEQSQIGRLEAEATFKRAEAEYEEMIQKYLDVCADLLPIAERIRELSIHCGRQFSVEHRSPGLVGPTIVIGGAVLQIPLKDK